MNDKTVIHEYDANVPSSDKEDINCAASSVIFLFTRQSQVLLKRGELMEIGIILFKLLIFIQLGFIISKGFTFIFI